MLRCGIGPRDWTIRHGRSLDPPVSFRYTVSPSPTEQEGKVDGQEI
jgi:hypothetical protein